MRTKTQERARYQWLTPAAFGDRIGTQDVHVRELIASGWFRRDTTPPECIDVARPGSKRPEYRIHPNALARFLKERAR